MRKDGARAARFVTTSSSPGAVGSNQASKPPKLPVVMASRTTLLEPCCSRRRSWLKAFIFSIRLIVAPPNRPRPRYSATLQTTRIRSPRSAASYPRAVCSVSKPLRIPTRSIGYMGGDLDVQRQAVVVGLDDVAHHDLRGGTGGRIAEGVGGPVVQLRRCGERGANIELHAGAGGAADGGCRRCHRG